MEDALAVKGAVEGAGVLISAGVVGVVSAAGGGGVTGGAGAAGLPGVPVTGVPGLTDLMGVGAEVTLVTCTFDVAVTTLSATFSHLSSNPSTSIS